MKGAVASRLIKPKANHEAQVSCLLTERAGVHASILPSKDGDFTEMAAPSLLIKQSGKQAPPPPQYLRNVCVGDRGLRVAWKGLVVTERGKKEVGYHP